MRLLLIDDDPDLVRTLVNSFRGLGFEIDAAIDGSAGWALACEARHDVIILDRLLPGLDGLELLRRIRRAGLQVPVLLLTARDGVDERVEGIEAGADDYVVKPFALTELVARVRMLQRRGRHRADPVLRFGDLEVDTARRVVRRGTTRITLSPREFQLLNLLLDRSGEVVNRAEIHAWIAPHASAVAGNSVDVLAGRLRRKLHLPGKPELVQTRRGIGYELALT